jgi:5-(carboxyamino)imidazole ribonucleotide synthase
MLKTGILGGGQLGRMLLQQAANYPVITHVMENDPHCPAAHLCHHFTLGNIQHYDDVIAFGTPLDLITIEIEAVNVEALEVLEGMGKVIIPRPAVLRNIKNKILQKNVYRSLQIPSPDFVVTQRAVELEQHLAFLPAVHKVAEGGYDGRGVQVLREAADLPKAFDAPAVLEKMIHIEKEIAITVAVGRQGQIAVYPPVEMVFDPVLNLLDYQLCPANIPQAVYWKAEAMAIQVAKGFDSAGLYAVEMLVDKEGQVWVNETAPRVHNSGHHTIEAHYCSQYDMLWRIILGYPLGNTDALLPSALVNLIGAPGHSGSAQYEGLPQLLEQRGLYVHIYGKTSTQPGRKMGHVTILGQDCVELTVKAKQVKETLQVVSHS